MIRYLFFSLILIFAAAQSGSAQKYVRTISGQVISGDEKVPLPGVLVYVKGTKNWSGSQQDGMYYIEVGDHDTVLVFSLDDYRTRELRLTGDNCYNIVLEKGQSAFEKGSLPLPGGGRGELSGQLNDRSDLSDPSDSLGDISLLIW
jgi:carboxypeptidase-like protein